MRKLLSLIFAMTAMVAGARQISPDEAATIASDFLNSSAIHRAFDSTTAQRAKSIICQAEALFYVFNADDNRGFVIISGDDRARKVLGYSDSGAFDFNNAPPQLTAMLEQYAKQVKTLPKSAGTDPSWSATAKSQTATDGLLLETANWGQGYPYNAQCPIIDGVQAPTGCVATAMAIIMKYHNWPEQGNGKHSDFFDSELQFDYGCYKPNWNIMDQRSSNDSFSEELIEELSTLFLSAGIAVDMQYYSHESGADITFLGNVMSSRFNYAPTKRFLKKDYTDLEWHNLIINEIDNERPILYSGFGSAGHTFIVDGYDNNNYYHINWGWDGNMNGYFSLSNLIVNDLDFSNNHEMIAGIQPNTSNIRYSSFIVNDGDGIFSDLKNRGFNFTVNKINPNESFGVVLPKVYGDVGNRGLIGLAVVDSFYNIIELIGYNAGDNCAPYPYLDFDDATHDMQNGCEQIYLYECGNFKYQKYLYIYNLHNLKFTTAIKPGYKLQLIGRDSPDSKWEIILGTDHVSTEFNLEKEVPSEWCDINFDYDSSLIDIVSRDDFSNDLSTVLRDGITRFDIIFGGAGIPSIECSPNGVIYLDNDWSDESSYVNAVFEATDNIYLKITLDKKVTDFSQIELQADEVALNGIIYKIGDKKLDIFEPNTYAYVIGYTSECKETVKVENKVIIDGSVYPVKAIIPGAFKDNTNIRHVDLSSSNLVYSTSALSFLDNIEYLTINSENAPPISSFLLYHSSRLKAVYEQGDFDSAFGPDCNQVSEFLYQVLGKEWKEWGIFPEWYISSPNKLLKNPQEIFISPGEKTEVSSPHYFVPGAFIISYDTPLSDNISEMWKYEVDIKKHMVYIKPLIEDLTIDDVIINGEKASANGYFYGLNLTDKSIRDINLDVVVNYTLHGRQSMNTHYTSEFNAALESDIYIPGDVDCNGTVNGMDLNAMISGLISPETSTLTPVTADINNDGIINGLDLNTLIINIIINQK